MALNGSLVELETDKVTQAVPAPAASLLREILLDRDAEAVPGAVLGRLGAAGSPPADVAATANRVEAESGLALASDADAPRDTVPAAAPGALSPAVRRAVKQHGIDRAALAGTERGGRLTRAMSTAR